MTASDALRRLRRDLWQSPRRHGELQRERTVGPLELFYDLVVVVLVGQAAHTLTHHASPRGFAEFASVFLVVWVAWFNGTSLHELHGREDVRSRNIFLGQVLLLVPLGAFVPGAGDRHGRAFAITAALLFLFLAYLWWQVSRADTEEYQRATHIYIGETFALAVGLAASTALSPDGRLIAWAVLCVLYLAAISVAFAFIPGRFEATFTITDALNERFGLLVIIVLGETVTGVVTGLTDDPTAARKLTAAIVCVLVGFGAWWTYFDFVGHREPRSDRTPTYAWLLAHLPITAAIAAMGAVMPILVEHANGHRTPVAPTWIMCGGAATVLVSTVVLMTTLRDWSADSMKLRPLAAAALLAAVCAVAIGVARPPSIPLAILLVAVFSGPWVYAVLHRVTLDMEGGGTGGGSSADGASDGGSGEALDLA